jgi:hypothetical protein
MRLRITCLYLAFSGIRYPGRLIAKLKHDQSRTSFELKSNCVSGSDVDAELTRLVEDAVQVEDDCTNVCNTRTQSWNSGSMLLHYGRNHKFSTFGENSLGPVWQIVRIKNAL